MSILTGAVAGSSRPPLGDPIASRLPFFYGWVILPIVTLAQILTAPGQTMGVSLFNPHFMSDLSLTGAQVSGAYMLGTLLAAAPQTYVGALMDRYGTRKTMGVIVVLLAATCASISRVSGLYTLFVGFFLLRLLGQGALSLTAANSLAMWFRDKLGRVAGIKSVGLGVAYAILPAIILSLITNFGWRTAYPIMGLAVLAILLPLILIFHRNRPEEVGQLPDGFKLESPPSPGNTQGPVPVPANEKLPSKTVKDFRETNYTLHEAMKTRAYWLMILSGGLWAMTGTAVVFHIVPIALDQGLTSNDAAAVLSTFWMCFACFQLLGGFLADRIPLNVLLSGAMGVTTGGLLVLIHVETSLMAHTATGLLGTAQGLMAAAGATLWVRYFGRLHLGKIRGSAGTVMVACSAFGPYLLSILSAQHGSYLKALWVFATPFALMIFLALWITKPEGEIKD